ncbi:MAG TPA: hypothetical protein VK851_12880, partial [Anaerolineales bacterium]|nr:hypothetical protein [Anaerolineales bacterium]
MRLKFCISALILLSTVGCSSRPSVEETQSSFTNRLQITYIQLKQEQNFSEFYVLDIACLHEDEICLGEPELLFQSLQAPSNEQN